MVRRALRFFHKEVRGLHEAAYLLALFALLSQILGLIRDRMFASNFGAGEILDVYYAAFRIPDLLFVIISTLVSVSVLIPFIVKKIDGSRENLQEFIDSIFSTLTIISLVLLAIAFIFTIPLLKLIVPDLLLGQYGNELVLITRVLLLQPFLLGISSLFSSIIQAYKRFYIYALSPILYNIGIILGVIYLYPKWGILGLAYGVVFGALLHLLIQIPTTIKGKHLPKFITNINIESIKEVLYLSLPRTFALTGSQLVLIFLIYLAGGMVVGSISVFTFSYNLQSVPMSIIGVSYSLAAFPTLSRLFSNGDIEKYVGHIVRATKHIVFWSFPVAILFIVLRAQIVRTILGAGEFSWTDTRLTAAALAIFAVSMVAQNLILLFVRGYYSAGDTKKPVILMLISSTITIILSFVFVSLFKSSDLFRHFIENLMRVQNIPGTIILMLPLAFSMGQIINATLLWIVFDLKYKCFTNDLWKSLFHSLGASLIMGYVTFLFLDVFDTVFDLNTLIGIFMQGLFSGIIGIVAGIFVLLLLGNKEIEIVFRTMKKKIFKTKLIAAEEEIGL